MSPEDILGPGDQDQDAAEPEASPADPLAEMTAERDGLKDKVLRLAAEQENFKKRTQRDKVEFLARANQNLLQELLPVLDNLDRALEAAGSHGGDQSIIEGMELTRGELVKVMERQGVERISALGSAFDPEVHEAMMQQEDPEAESGTVLQVVQEGYLYKGRLLRPAMVVVSKRPAGSEDDEGSVIDITVN